jgi:cell volume regulation protein A
MAFALLTFGLAQTLGASGFLAVYLAGLVVGNRRHRAAQLIDRFHDGLAWLAQMVMFVMLGLLVTPSNLLPTLIPAILIAGFLVVVARPLAVVLCLLPFRFAWNEHAFVAWVGLRGAVAIFLGTIPVLAGLTHAQLYFEIAFVVVLVSLMVQGWTVARVARALDLELPPLSQPARRIDIDLPTSGDRDLMIYTVGPRSRVSLRGVRRLLQLQNTSLVGVIRDGRLLRPRDLDRLEPGDSVLVIAPPAHAATLDALFAGQPDAAQDPGVFGEFAFDGELPVGKLAEFYDFALEDADRTASLADLVQQRIGRTPVVGDRIRLADIELVVQEMQGERIARVGLELEPRTSARPTIARLRAWLRRLLAKLRGRAAPAP